MTPAETVLNYVGGLSRTGFWGFVTIKFENGRPVHLRREENFKPDQLPQLALPETTRSLQNESNPNN